jgi:hypothetical protein
MPLYTVTMKNGDTYQVREDDKEAAKRHAIRKARLDNFSEKSGPITPKSVKQNK